MIAHIENPIDSTKKLVNLISGFSKIVGYKGSIQKLMGFFCTPTMNYQKEKLGEKIPFTITTRKIKYLGVNLIFEYSLCIFHH